MSQKIVFSIFRIFNEHEMYTLLTIENKKKTILLIICLFRTVTFQLFNIGRGREMKGKVSIVPNNSLTRYLSIPIVLKLRIVIYKYKPSVGILIREFE